MGLLIEAARVLILTVLGATSMVSDRGVATRFGDPGDPLDGDHLSCTHVKMQPGQLACAHRTLPCGTVLVIENPRTRRVALCEVLDRGPFGALLPSGDWLIKRHRDEPGDWRGILDMSPAVANALDFNGREHVRIYYQRIARHLRAATKSSTTSGRARGAFLTGDARLVCAHVRRRRRRRKRSAGRRSRAASTR